MARRRHQEVERVCQNDVTEVRDCASEEEKDEAKECIAVESLEHFPVLVLDDMVASEMGIVVAQRF